MRHARLIFLLAACHAIVACSEQPPSAPLPDPAMPPIVATASRTMTPADIAQRIAEIEFEDTTQLGGQYSKARCDENEQRDGWIIRCRIGVKDSQRDKPGLVERGGSASSDRFPAGISGSA